MPRKALNRRSNSWRQKIPTMLESIDARLNTQPAKSSSQKCTSSQRNTAAGPSNSQQSTANETSDAPSASVAANPPNLIRSETGNSPTSSPGQRIHLCDLPADIRNYIYSFVCYHEGPISPACAEVPPSSYDTRDHFSRSALGQVHRLHKIKSFLDRRTLPMYTWNQSQTSKQVFNEKADEWILCGGSLEDYVVTQTRHYDRQHRGYEFLHICSKKCLRPPSLTQVNRQLRQEVMSYFYGSNKFRFAFGINENEAASVFLKWIRGLRKHAFQLIDHLELVRYNVRTGRTMDHDIHDAITITKDRNTQGWSVQILDANKEMERTAGPPDRPRKRYRVLRQKHMAERWAKRIEANGPSTRRLEMLLCCQRWYRRHPMRNETLIREHHTAMQMFMAEEAMGRVGKIRLMEERLKELPVELVVHGPVTQGSSFDRALS